VDFSATAISAPVERAPKVLFLQFCGLIYFVQTVLNIVVGDRLAVLRPGVDAN
jgi:hypothetical protein